MAQYYVGFINLTNQSDMVSGINTEFIGNVKPKDVLYVKNGSEVSGPYTIDRVMGDKILYLAQAYTGPSLFRAKYAITRNFTQGKLIPNVFIGDEIIAMPIKNGMSLLSNILENENSSGITNPKVVTSIEFSQSLYIAGENKEFCAKVIGLPGYTTSDDQFFEQCNFSISGDDNQDHFYISYSTRGNVYIQSKYGSVSQYDGITIVATVSGRADLVASAKLSIESKPTTRMTSYSIGSPLKEVPYNETIVIKPEIVPTNAENANFGATSFSTSFDSLFSFKTIEGRQLEIMGKNNSETAAFFDIYHKEENPDFACGNKLINLMCTRMANKISSIIFNGDGFEVDAFGYYEFPISFLPAFTAANWSADFNTVITNTVYLDSDHYNFQYAINFSFDIKRGVIKLLLSARTDDNYNEKFQFIKSFRFLITASNPRSNISKTIEGRLIFTPCSGCGAYVDPIIKIGEIKQVSYSPQPAEHSEDEYALIIANPFFQPLNYSSNDGLTYFYKKGTPIFIKGVGQGETSIAVRPRYNVLCNSPYQTVTVSADTLVIDKPVTGISVVDFDGIFSEEGSILSKKRYRVTISPSDATVKGIRLTTTTPFNVKFDNEYHYSETFNVIDFIVEFTQKGTGNITISALDASGIQVSLSVMIDGLPDYVPLESITFDYNNILNLETNETISITPGTELPVRQNGGMFKIPVILSPSNCTEKTVYYEAYGSCMVSPHVDYNPQSFFKSTNDYVVVRGGYLQTYGFILAKGLNSNISSEKLMVKD